jgi:glutamate-1-semialdehyde 2,1-aminomutase
MFCIFFADRDIINVSDVMKQDLAFFRKFFWGCLDKGIYLAPSPYETGFLSLAHTEADLDDTLSVFREVLSVI